MARIVDVHVSQQELGDFNKQPTTLVKLDPGLLIPTACTSKMGRSTNAHNAHLGGPRPRSALSVGEYATLFEKFYGVEAVLHTIASRTGRATTANARQNQSSTVSGRNRAMHSVPDPYDDGGTGASPYDDDDEGDVDSRIEQAMRTQSSRVTKAKNLPPRVAARYGVPNTGSTSAGSSRLSAAKLGISVIPAGGMPREVQNTLGDAASSTKAAELAAALAATAARDNRRQRAQRSQETGLAGAAARSRAAARPGSAPFLSATREKAGVASSRFLEAGRDAPGPGKYTARYSSQDMRIPGTHLISHHVARRTRETGWAAPPAVAEGTGEEGTDGALHGEPSKPPLNTLAAAAARTVQNLDAHRIHEVKPSLPAGTASFRAPARPALNATTTASHLACTYFKDGYDAPTVTKTGFSARFAVQTRRPEPGTMADTPPALGPGSYSHRELPATTTGRHVSAGHRAMQNTPTIGRRSGVHRPRSAAEQRADRGVRQVLWGLENTDYPELMSLQLLQSQMRGLPPPGTAIINHRATAHMYSPRTSEDGQPGGGRGATPKSQGPGPYLGHPELHKYSSTGLEKRVQGGAISELTRPGAVISLRAYCDGRIVPPASCPQHGAQGAENVYQPDDAVQGHRPRSPGWQLPPNRAALSQQRMVPAAAIGYV